MTEREFYTVMEFADKLRVHPNTIRSAIEKGRIQAVRVGVGSRSKFRIPSTEVSRICEMDMMSCLKRLIDDAIEEKKSTSS